MKRPFKRTESLAVAESAAIQETVSHVHGKRTRIFLRAPVVTTTSKNVLTNVELVSGALVKTFETITYVIGVTFTDDRAVVDILTQTDNDVNE